MSFDLISALPTEQQMTIFSAYLNPRDRAQCAVSCSKWNAIVEHPDLWRQIAATIFTMGPLKEGGEKDIVKHHFTQRIRSNDELVQRIEEFLNKIQFLQTGRFRGFFGQGKGLQTVSIEVASRKIALESGYMMLLSGKPEWEMNQRRFDIEDEYYSLQKIPNGDLEKPITKFYVANVGDFFWSHGGRMCAEPRQQDIIMYCSMGFYKARMELPWFNLKSSVLHEKIKCLVYVKLKSLESERSKSGCLKKYTPWIQLAGQFLQGIVWNRITPYFRRALRYSA